MSSSLPRRPWVRRARTAAGRLLLRLLPGVAFPRANVAAFRLMGYDVHPSVRIYPDAEIVGAIGVEIGEGTYIGSQVRITGGLARIAIGRRCDLSDRVSIVCGTHEIDPGGSRVAGRGLGRDVVIEDGVWIGYGALVLPGVHIGAHSVIGAGAVVARDIPARSVAAGNPCRVLRTLPPS